jgi:hypothetical protein
VGEHVAQQALHHLALVVIAEPAVDVDRADLGGGAGRFEDRHDPRHG